MNENVAKRLAFIRYLYDEAVRQSQKSEPMCSLSVLTFHDAAELFLVLACEHLDVAKKSMDFLAYWEEIKRKLPEGLTQKKGMGRLNVARVGLKHHGNMPARSAVQEFRVIATLFFKENTPTVFGVKFEGISMVDLVRDRTIKGVLEEAEELCEQGDFQGAVGRVAVAFYLLLGHYQRQDLLLPNLKWPNRTSTPAGYKYGGPPINFRSRRGEADKDGYARKKIGEVLEQTDALKKAMEPMQDAMVALALDVEYKQYRRFLDLTPPVGMMNRTEDLWAAPVPTPLYHPHRPQYVDEYSYQFCFDFVIEAILHAQAA